eukprot:gene29266-38336_t
MFKILCVCTSADEGRWGGKTGLWLDELSIPYYVLKDAGYDIEICSIRGGPPAIDPAIFKIDLHPSTERFLEDVDAQSNFRSALSIECYAQSISTGSMHQESKSVDYQDDGPESKNLLGSFSALYLCGGHGCLEDFDNDALRMCVEHMFSVRRGCVGAICHGPLGLAGARQSAGFHRGEGKGEEKREEKGEEQQGKLLLSGKFVAAFSNEEEDELGLRERLPQLTEDVMDAQGAICVPAEPWKPNVVVDGRLVTGQNPQSSLEIALRMLDVLRSLGDEFSGPLNVNKPWGNEMWLVARAHGHDALVAGGVGMGGVRSHLHTAYMHA